MPQTKTTGQMNNQMGNLASLSSPKYRLIEADKDEGRNPLSQPGAE